MTSANLWLCVSLCFVCFHGADGFLHYGATRCVFNSTDLKDIQYINSMYFYKREFIRFDSRVGQYVGYTEYGVKQAEIWNKDPGQIAYRKSLAEAYCKPNAGIDYSAALEKTVVPDVALASETPPGGGKHTHMLKCSSYEFYPKRILVTWLRGEEEITSGVTSTDLLPDGDWYYQYHSYLEYTPRSGEQISCMVEHPGLTAPLFVHWDDSMPDGVKNKLAIGASGLVLGLVLFLTGFIYFHWKKRGRILVPTTTN